MSAPAGSQLTCARARCLIALDSRPSALEATGLNFNLGLGGGGLGEPAQHTLGMGPAKVSQKHCAWRRDDDKNKIAPTQLCCDAVTTHKRQLGPEAPRDSRVCVRATYTIGTVAVDRPMSQEEGPRARTCTRTIEAGKLHPLSLRYVALRRVGVRGLAGSRAGSLLAHTGGARRTYGLATTTPSQLEPGMKENGENEFGKLAAAPVAGGRAAGRCRSGFSLA